MATRRNRDLRTIATIGRPGIGGEFLAVCPIPPETTGRMILERRKQLTATRAERRQLGVADLPAETLVYDLISAVEAIAARADLDLDRGSIIGNQRTLRQRLQALADRPRRP